MDHRGGGLDMRMREALKDLKKEDFFRLKIKDYDDDKAWKKNKGYVTLIGKFKYKEFMWGFEGETDLHLSIEFTDMSGNDDHRLIRYNDNAEYEFEIYDDEISMRMAL